MGWPSNEFLARWRGSGAEVKHVGGINLYSGNTFVGENEQGRALAETVQDQHYPFAGTRASVRLPSGETTTYHGLCPRRVFVLCVVAEGWVRLAVG